METHQRRTASFSPDTVRICTSHHALQAPEKCTVDTLCCLSMETTALTDRTWVTAQPGFRDRVYTRLVPFIFSSTLRTVWVTVCSLQVHWEAVYLASPPCPSCSAALMIPVDTPRAMTTPIGCPPTKQCPAATPPSLEIYCRVTSAGNTDTHRRYICFSNLRCTVCTITGVLCTV